MIKIKIRLIMYLFYAYWSEKFGRSSVPDKRNGIPFST